MSRQLKPISQSHSDGPEGHEQMLWSGLFKGFLHRKCEKVSALLRDTYLIFVSSTNRIKQKALFCLRTEM